MTSKEVLTIGDAIVHASNTLKRGGVTVWSMKYTNGHRHALLYTNIGQAYLLFKRDQYHTYGQELVGKKATGESINACTLRAITQNNKIKYIFVVYPNGKIYYTKPYAWNTYGIIRTQKNGENTVNIDIKYLNPLGNLIKDLERQTKLGDE